MRPLRSGLLELLADPLTGEPLELDGRTLRGPGGAVYPVRDGIPRFEVGLDDAQEQTGKSFGFKWSRRETYDSPQMGRVALDWLVRRYGFADEHELRAYFRSRKRILDAGCGSGFSAALCLGEGWPGLCWVGIDLSSAVDVARERLGGIAGVHLVQGDLLRLPFRRGSFDTVFAEGSLHHTPSTRAALSSVVSALAPGGDILFYVYRLKAPAREFVDDHVRAAMAGLPPEEAWEALRPLTRLGQSLAELGAEVEVPEDVPLLGIEAGRYDVQRLVYWHFAKLFWNPDLSFEENNHVNFDWYHPRYAHRQTEEDVRRWCEEEGLAIHRFHVEQAGLTVRALKP